MASKTLVALLLVLLLIVGYFGMVKPMIDAAKSARDLAEREQNNLAGTCGTGNDCTPQYIPPGEKLEYSTKIETPLEPIFTPSGGNIEVIQAPAGIPHSARKAGTTIDTIVLHHTGGSTAQGAIDWWKSSKTASAHYIVDKDGTIYQTVDEKYKAWHAGCCIKKTSDCSTCINPEAATYNDRSIGIEIVNKGCEEYTPEQYASLSAMIGNIRSRRPAILKDNSHIIGHFEVTSDKWDVSSIFAWSKIDLSGHPTTPCQA